MGRVWLIGNGSSLKHTPLERIKDDTIGLNKIGRIFSPTRYVKIDYAQLESCWDDWKAEILPMLGRPCMLWDVFRDGVKVPGQPFSDSIPEGIGDQPNVFWVPRCEHHAWTSPGWHDPICTAYNSIAPMAQWAVKLGYDEIVLVGCDLNFTDGKTDHFDENYYTEVDIFYRGRANTMTFEAHKFIKANCPIPVYNATIGGQLNLFPRRDFFELV